MYGNFATLDMTDDLHLLRCISGFGASCFDDLVRTYACLLWIHKCIENYFSV